MGTFQVVKLLGSPVVIDFTGGVNPTGPYSGATAYVLGDSVSYNGSSYVALQSTTGNLPTNTTYWQLLAEKGDTGATGPTGPTGPSASWGTVTGTLSSQTDLFNDQNNLIDWDGAYYLTAAASDLGAGRLEMTKAISAGGGASESFTGVTNGAYLSSFCSVVGFPNADHLPAGPLAFNISARQTAGTQVAKLYAEFYVREVAGTQYLLGTTPVSEALTGSDAFYKAHVSMPPYRTMGLTDRLLIRFKVEVTGAGTAPDVTLSFQGTYVSRVKFPSEPYVAPLTVDWGDIGGTLASQTDLQGAIDAKQDEITGNNSKIVYKDDTGVVKSLESHDIYVNGSEGVSVIFPMVNNAGIVAKSVNYSANATINAPASTFTGESIQVNIDTDSDGFQLGTAGSGATVLGLNVLHSGASDTGSLAAIKSNLTIGNGTDPIDVKGFGYAYGFGTVAAYVNISGNMSGYGYQPNINALATIDPASGYTSAFYDAAIIGCETTSYSSFSTSPTLASLANNSNYTGVNVYPTITAFTGNAGVNGVAVSGNYGTMNANSGFNGVNINPTITSARYAAGVNVSMDNVTPYAGVQSTLTAQDLTFTFTQPGDNDTYTMEYTTGGTAGSEVVSITGQAIEVQIDSGVSTATQVKAALEANFAFSSNVTVTVSGTGSNAQVAFGPSNFANGEWPGRVMAAYLDGDVEITGALTFGGALSIGKLNAYASQAIIDGGGTPSSIHSLISQPTVAANATIANADLLAVNTAALITIGSNATVTTAFVGVAALGLPAVLTMGSGATLDRCYGAIYALSLDAGAGGGTVDEMGLCRAVAIPNGVTTVNALYGYLFDLPFGDPGTTTFGFYDRPGKHNYFGGSVLVGGTAGSDDTVTNSSVALEIKSTTKAFMNARMTTSERNALTAVNGMQIYNTTDDKLQVYAAGAWVNLH